MKRFFLAAVLLFSFTSPVYSADGMIDVKSVYSVEETAARMEAILKEKGMTLFSRISHSDGAKNVGINLRETELIIFGNPRVGSPLMQCQQSVAIDLPQKALIWKDAKGNAWLSYNAPRYLVKRHTMKGCEDSIAKIEKALAAMVKAASGR